MTTPLLGLEEGFVVSHLQLGFNSVCSLDRAWIMASFPDVVYKARVGLARQSPGLGFLWGVGINWSAESEFEAWCCHISGFICSS